MFEHSVKVPRHYKVAAQILKEVTTKGGSVKTLLYDEKLRHFRTNVLYALISETIKHSLDIDKIFECSNILNNEQRLDPWLAKVLTAELLFGKKLLPGKSKPEQTILSYKEQFVKLSSSCQDTLKTEVIRRPRYVRINTNLLTTSDAIGTFQDEGYRFIRCTSSSYDDYLKQIQNLSEYDFTQDYHVKTVFVFSSGTKLHDHDLYLENKIILQDKATALAVHLLAPETGSVVLDMCAAPGMKTTQLAAYMRNQGKIIAVERNEKRYQTLCDFVKRTESKCVETVHKDALEIKRGEYSDVEYILLDPSCSGSGMELSVHNYIDAERLSKLTSLQEKFLKHAMNAFPRAKRIVYSTCSLLPEENERVITNVVKTSRAKWRVQDVKELLKGQWNNVGSGMYGSIGTRCIYAKPDSDFTIGFFLAVLDRELKDDNDHSKSNGKFKNTACGVHDDSNNAFNTLECSGIQEVNNKEFEIGEEISVKNKKKKNKNKTQDCELSNVHSELARNEHVVDDTDLKNKEEIKKRKKNRNKIENDVGEESRIKLEHVKSEKKRKHTSEVVQSVDIQLNDVFKPKKNKKDAVPFNSETTNEVCDDNSYKIEKNKKKKRSADISNSDIDVNQLDAVFPKSEKKKKRLLPLDSETLTDALDDGSYKMKKKKKKKYSNDISNEIDMAIDDTKVVKKKKKYEE